MNNAAVSNVGVLRAVDAARTSKGLSKAELARRAGVSSASLRRLLTDGAASPHLASVLNLLRPMGLGLAVVPVRAEGSANDTLVSWLAHYGAPLYGADVSKEKVVPSVEEALARGLVLARESGTVARALPCAFWFNENKLDLDRLLELGDKCRQGKALGFFLELTSELSGRRSPATMLALESLRSRHAPTPLLSRPEQFFRPTTRLERRLAELNTPEVGRRWCFRMNMDLECFASMFRKATT